MRGDSPISSTPSNRVSTNCSYAFGSVTNLIVAPSRTSRFTRLRRWIGPVRNVPAGTTTRPPPAALHSATASRKASVQSVAPSPFAPNRVTGNVRAGMRGGLMRARIEGTRSHPCSSATPGPREAPDRMGWVSAALGNRVTPATAAAAFTNSRRDGVDIEKRVRGGRATRHGGVTGYVRNPRRSALTHRDRTERFDRGNGALLADHGELLRHHVDEAGDRGEIGAPQLGI